MRNIHKHTQLYSIIYILILVVKLWLKGFGGTHVSRNSVKPYETPLCCRWDSDKNHVQFSYNKGVPEKESSEHRRSHLLLDPNSVCCLRIRFCQHFCVFPPGRTMDPHSLRQFNLQGSSNQFQRVRVNSKKIRSGTRLSFDTCSTLKCWRWESQKQLDHQICQYLHKARHPHAYLSQSFLIRFADLGLVSCAGS